MKSAGKDNMGQVMARRFAKEGAKLVLAGRNEDSLKEISEETGGSYVLCDITKKEEIADRDYNVGLNLVPSGGLIFNDFFYEYWGRSAFFAWMNDSYIAFFITNKLYDEIYDRSSDTYNLGMAVRCTKDY